MYEFSVQCYRYSSNIHAIVILIIIFSTAETWTGSTYHKIFFSPQHQLARRQHDVISRIFMLSQQSCPLKHE
jgi:hypothetical protein